jgi:transcriptional regulator with PAS, ATPase and Fis domain
MTLAQLLVNLCGEQAFGEVERLIGAHMARQWIEYKRQAIERHQQKSVLEQQHLALKSIIGESQHILRVCEQIIQYAPTTLPVRITGPAGSGKELIACAIHACSPRKLQPFVRINCASIPESLFESEMHGHAKGAFTGADQDRSGYLEQAHGGSLFLDEIGKLPLLAQGKLLRVLQSGEFYRVGDSKLRKVNVRTLAATNQNLLMMVAEGKFLEDLYGRLRGITMTLPPFEDRLADLQPLVRHFIERSGLAAE